MNGTADNTFSPKAHTTRGMVVTVLYRLENQPSTSAASFTDVTSGAYYANAVAWANANGIVSGYGSGKFGPNDKVTREQLAAILYRYAQYKKYDVSGAKSLDGYTDAQSVSSYAVPALQWANAAGVVTGKSGSKLDPKGKEKEGNLMPIGVIVNCISVLAGGVIGSALGQVLPNSLKEHLPTLFGMCSIAIGINSIIKAVSMTAVVLAILVGFTIGHLLHLEDWASRFFHRLVKTMHLGGDNIDMEFYITAVALFCCSGFGWYSTLTEGIAGDPNLLFAKSVLDFFTAMIFASTLGKAICAIPLPQCVILLCVFTAGRLLSGALTPEMFADLSACGGVLTMSAGFRVSKIKSVPLVDLMPALILVMPFSALWTMLMG